MNIKGWPFFIILVLFPIESFFLLKENSWSKLIFFAVGTVAWAWNGWAYWKDKDMLSRGFAFKFNRGENQDGRTIYVVALVIMYIVVVVFG